MTCIHLFKAVPYNSRNVRLLQTMSMASRSKFLTTRWVGLGLRLELSPNVGEIASGSEVFMSGRLALNG
jgi:hypothetical protein